MLVTTTCALAAFYMLGLVYAIGWMSRIEWPWQPLSGKPVAEVYALLTVPHAFAVAAVSLCIGLAVALLRTSRPFALGLLIALPATAELAWSIQASSMLSGTFGRSLMLLENGLVILFFPAVMAAIMDRVLCNPRFKGTGRKQPWPAA